MSTLDTKIDTTKSELTGLINEENSRATTAEENLGKQITSTKTELEKAINAEKTRAEGIEANLQEQIDENEKAIQSNANAIALVMDNPNTEVIDSVKELVNYVEEHGTVVTGIQNDIKANSEAIATEVTNRENADNELKEDISAIEQLIDSEGSPTILVDTTGALDITDEQGNKIATVDSKGFRTTNVSVTDKVTASEIETDTFTTDAITLGEEDLGTKLTDMKSEYEKLVSVSQINAQAAAGMAVRLVLRVGEAPQATPQENLKNLLKFGSQFDNIEIK